MLQYSQNAQTHVSLCADQELFIPPLHPAPQMTHSPDFCTSVHLTLHAFCHMHDALPFDNVPPVAVVKFIDHANLVHGQDAIPTLLLVQPAHAAWKGTCWIATGVCLCPSLAQGPAERF